MWENDPTQTQSQCSAIPGRDLESAGITSFSDLTSHDQDIFNNYKDAISKKIRQEKDLHLPEGFKLVPTSIAKQTESSENCYFRIDLPHSVVIVKIIPIPHITDLSKTITIHREPFETSSTSLIELIL